MTREELKEIKQTLGAVCALLLEYKAQLNSLQDKVHLLETYIKDGGLEDEH